MFCQKTCHFCFSNWWAQTAFILIGTKVTEKYMYFQGGVPKTAFSKAGKHSCIELCSYGFHDYRTMCLKVFCIMQSCLVLCWWGNMCCSKMRWMASTLACSSQQPKHPDCPGTPLHREQMYHWEQPLAKSSLNCHFVIIIEHPQCAHCSKIIGKYNPLPQGVYSLHHPIWSVSFSHSAVTIHI